MHILHTNDLHSQFAHMPQIASCLKQHRARWEEQGEHVLTVDVGDHLDRMSIKTEATWGRSNVEVLNRSGYQYVTIGNNEGITLPKEKLDVLYRDARFTVVLNNLQEAGADGPLPWAVPFAIHEWPDLRVALLGATVPFAEFYRLLGWEAKDPLPILAEQVRMLRPKVDAIVVLSHLGLRADRELARKIPGIDVILGGHTHELLKNGEQVGSTLIAQAGKFGEYVGHVRLTLGSKGVVAAEAECLRAADYPYDPQIVQLIADERVKAEKRLSAPVARLEQDWPVNWERETALGSLLAACIRKWTGAEIGLANSGLLLTSLHSGVLTRKDLLQCLPHPINPCAVTLTGEQLLGILTRAIQPEVVHRELRGFGFRGKIAGWLGVDGLKIRYALEPAPQILQVLVGDVPLENGREYRVGTVDMFVFNRMFPELLEGRDMQFFLPEVLREIAAELLNDRVLLQSCLLPRWELAHGGG
nr:bifunctional UDP-sugar hydrolase/5'-nucleotidase [Brevibacillus sp. SYP-B805]